MRKKLNRKNSSSARTVEELKKIQRNSFIKLSVMCIILFVILLFYSVAWFTMNREISGDELQMAAVDTPFEIRTEGAAGYSDDYLPQGENGYIRLSDMFGTLITSGSQQKIEWLVTDEYNAYNYADGNSSLVRPGSKGVLHFWIVPRNQESMTLRFTMQITPYKKQYPKKDDGSPDYEQDPTAVPMTDSDEDKALAGYVNAHILFFRYNGDNPEEVDNTKYSKLIDDSITETIKFEKDSNGNLLPYEMKIYWIWPETLGEAVLTDSDTRTAVCETSPDGNNELLTKFNRNPGDFLKNYTLPEGVTDLTQADITKDYPSLSIRYNNADQDIGDNIMYLLAEMIVEYEN